MTTIPINQINPSPHPVRSSWDEDAMQELAQSIREQGVIVPIKVRPIGSDYEIVYGHRRVEAARRAGLEEIPAIVEGVEDTDALIQALIENVQREDMSHLDIAKALAQIKEMTGKTNKQISDMFGWKSGSSVTGHLAMLAPNLLPIIESHDQDLQPTHIIYAKAAANTPNEEARILQKVVDEGLTELETRRVAHAYRDARTDDEREAILKVRGDHPAFERAVAVQMGVDRAEEIQERKTTRRHQENDREVAQFFDAVRAFMMVVETMISAVDFGKFSQEGARFATRRIDALIEKLQQLKGQLNNE